MSSFQLQTVTFVYCIQIKGTYQFHNILQIRKLSSQTLEKYSTNRKKSLTSETALVTDKALAAYGHLISISWGTEFMESIVWKWTCAARGVMTSPSGDAPNAPPSCSQRPEIPLTDTVVRNEVEFHYINNTCCFLSEAKETVQTNASKTMGNQTSHSPGLILRKDFMCFSNEPSPKVLVSRVTSYPFQTPDF